MTRIVLLSLTVSLLIVAGCSQRIDKEKLDAYFDTLASNEKFMGSVAVSHNGKLIYTKTVGYADIESVSIADKNSKYRISSISKTFATVLVFKAIEEKRLRLDQTLDQFFPAIVNAEKITIEQMLYHRSGIRDIMDENWPDWRTKPKTEQELIEMITASGSDFEPDTQVDYINSAFILLTVILEKLYQKPYPELLAEKIIKPLGLKNTYYGGKINIEKNECNSYIYDEFWEKEPETDLSIVLGAAAIVSTPIDLTRFSDALFNGKSKRTIDLPGGIGVPYLEHQIYRNPYIVQFLAHLITLPIKT
jgi:CubicO group peptidase (beta-lactamase class C family)